VNWLDIVVLVLIIVPAVIGLKIGVIKAVLSLIGVIVGIILAGQYHEALGGQLTFISQTNIADIVAFAIILFAVMIAAAVIATLLHKIASMVLLGWANHLGGAILGLILGALFCGALLAIWVKFLGAGATITDSVLATFLLERFPLILSLLPAKFDSIRPFFQ